MTPNQPESTKARDVAQEGQLTSTVNASELFEIHARLQKTGGETADRHQASCAIIARQRGEIEALTESLRRFETSLREARNHVDTLGVALDRIKIVALNTGLEGARLGDLAGKALISVSDELRNLTSRGLELLSDQASTVEQMEVERQRLGAVAEREQNQLNELDGILREASISEQVANQTLVRLAQLLQQSTGLDVEAAARLGRVTEHARRLAESLANLSKPEYQPALRAALLPALEPLLTWISSASEAKP
jgi:hypothetical protein